MSVSDKRSFFSTVKNWVARHIAGHLCTEDEKCPGKPTQITILENEDANHFVILSDERISAKIMAETLMISQERVGYIIHEILDMRKLSATLVLNCINGIQNRDRVLASKSILNQFRMNRVGFLTLS
jgi:hypothetical protein